MFMAMTMTTFMFVSFNMREVGQFQFRNTNSTQNIEFANVLHRQVVFVVVDMSSVEKDLEVYTIRENYLESKIRFL